MRDEEALLSVERLELTIPTVDEPVVVPPLSVGAGEWVTVTGPSGRGKSTLLETLAGLRTPRPGRGPSWTGRFRVGDAALSDEPEPGRSGHGDLAAYRRHVAWLPQRPQLEPGAVRDSFTILAHWPDSGVRDEGAVLHDARQILIELELPDAVLDQSSSTLSGGEITRVALARILLLKRPVLLLDEPGASLDTARSRRAREAVTRHLPGSAVLVAAHDEVWPIGASTTVEVGR